MSIGEGAYANLVAWDDNEVVYEYGGYTFNDKRFRNENNLMDGVITIQRKCFAEPEIHEKLKTQKEMDKLIKNIVKDMDAGRTVEIISERNRVEKKLVEEILQIYTTHPGIDVDGILNRMEN